MFAEQLNELDFAFPGGNDSRDLRQTAAGYGAEETNPSPADLAGEHLDHINRWNQSGEQRLRRACCVQSRKADSKNTREILFCLRAKDCGSGQLFTTRKMRTRWLPVAVMPYSGVAG